MLGGEFDDNSAAVAQQLQALSTADSALAETLDEVAVTAKGVSAGGLFNIRASSGPNGWETKITARVKATADGSTYEAGWYVLVNSNGESVYAARANTFALISSGTSGTIYTPFSIDDGKIKMTGDVEIDGDLLLRGSLITDRLAEHAVTDYVITSPGGRQEDGGEVRRASITVDNNADVHVRCSGYQYRPDQSSGNYGYYQLRLKRDGDVIAESPYFYDDNFSQPFIIETVDRPSNGQHTYSCDYDVTSGSGRVDLGKAVMVLNEHKR